MIKNLTSIGNSLGLIIDKPILELLKIDKDTQLEVVTDGTGLIIRPIHEAADVSKSRSESAAPRKTPETAAPAPPKAKKQKPPPMVPKSEEGEGVDPVPAPEPEHPVAAQEPAEKPSVIVDLKGKDVLRIPLDKDEVILGRDKKCDIHLDDRGLSRRHAQLERRGGSIWVSDLGSSNGTYVNGEPITSAICLHQGDVVTIGLYRVRVEGLEQMQAGTPILTLRGPEGTHRFALTGEQITIGRGQKNDISIPHKSISRKHILIRFVPSGFVAEDMGSQNGIKINGMRIDGPTEFSAGTTLEVCEFQFDFGYTEDEEKSAGAAEKRPSTMLIDRSVVVNAAYVGGDFEHAESHGGMLSLSARDNQEHGLKQDTGEFKVPNQRSKDKARSSKKR
jgi:pSer/pThr/pTyr-binding forkhead associated (FHA) protein/antitoxin component of MazEF toxin-antitoxin module